MISRTLLKGTRPPGAARGRSRRAGRRSSAIPNIFLVVLWPTEPIRMVGLAGRGASCLGLHFTVVNGRLVA